MGITNPAEAYFKDGTWGWDGTQWRKLAMVFGLTERYLESVINTNAPGGSNYLTGSTVPAGEIWVVTSICAWNINTAVSHLYFLIYDGATDFWFRRLKAQVADQGSEWKGTIYLEVGDRVRVKMDGCAAGDDIHMHIAGYKMAVT